MLVGLIPLLSLKQTLFFANEVPGIVVPAAILERMRRAAEKGKEHERAEGMAIARELAAGDRPDGPRHPHHAHGPYATVAEVLEASPPPARAPTTPGPESHGLLSRFPCRAGLP